MAGFAGRRFLQLPRLHPLPGHLHQPVGAALMDEIALGIAHEQVARAEPAVELERPLGVSANARNVVQARELHGDRLYDGST